jgi:tRNA-splicing ligase RtcB
MRSGINCALANRQILTELVRRTFAKIFPKANLQMLYDVSHNTAKFEEHNVDGKMRKLLIHRKGATRAFGINTPDLSDEYKPFGQPVLIGGSMGTVSYILCGTNESMGIAFGSACHGAGRSLSRTAAAKQFKGGEIIRTLAGRNIIIKSDSMRGLAKKVAKLKPLICIKG